MNVTHDLWTNLRSLWLDSGGTYSVTGRPVTPVCSSLELPGTWRISVGRRYLEAVCVFFVEAVNMHLHAVLCFRWPERCNAYGHTHACEECKCHLVEAVNTDLHTILSFRWPEHWNAYGHTHACEEWKCNLVKAVNMHLHAILSFRWPEHWNAYGPTHACEEWKRHLVEAVNMHLHAILYFLLARALECVWAYICL